MGMERTEFEGPGVSPAMVEVEEVIRKRRRGGSGVGHRSGPRSQLVMYSRSFPSSSQPDCTDKTFELLLLFATCGYVLTSLNDHIGFLYHVHMG